MQSIRSRPLFLLLGVLMSGIFATAAADVIGAHTTGGDGGEEIRVTTLADSGPGSLRRALATSGARMITFDVAGVIYLESDLKIANPNVTIAGETAPSPGITLAHASLRISASDVIVRHLRIRVGDGPGPKAEDRDGISIVGNRRGTKDVHDVLIENCSISWAIDEGISTWYVGVRNVTVKNTIIAEGLARSLHPKGEHSMGMLIGPGSQGILVQGNLFAHNNWRNPVVHAGARAVIVNNLIYNPGKQGIHFYPSPKRPVALHASVIGNVVRAGPNTGYQPELIWGGLNPGTELYFQDNESDGTRAFITDSAQFRKLPFNPLLNEARVWSPDIAVISPGAVVETVLAEAGARPWDRDATDTRIVTEVRDRGGKIRNRAPMYELSQ